MCTAVAVDLGLLVRGTSADLAGGRDFGYEPLYIAVFSPEPEKKPFTDVPKTCGNRAAFATRGSKLKPAKSASSAQTGPLAHTRTPYFCSNEDAPWILLRPCVGRSAFKVRRLYERGPHSLRSKPNGNVLKCSDNSD